MKTKLGKGSYIIILHLSSNRKIKIGKLKDSKFIQGYYAYVGSAFGPGGLTARLNHHLKISTKPHWHIDYLRKYSEVKEIWYSESEIKAEHKWAKILSAISSKEFIIQKFGSSDCNCATHLFYFKNYPSYDYFIKSNKKQTVKVLKWF